MAPVAPNAASAAGAKRRRWTHIQPSANIEGTTWVCFAKHPKASTNPPSAAPFHEAAR